MKKKIILAARKKILFLPHAIKQMSHPDRMITAGEIKETILKGEIIEEYPDDRRGESCLVFHLAQNRAIHVVCSPKVEYLAIITAYLPAKSQWSSDCKVRI